MAKSPGMCGGAAAAIVCLLATGFSAAPAAPVQAQGLLEFLFNSSRHAERRRQIELRERVSEREFYVSGPKYYTYRPDEPKRVALAPLAEPRPADNGAVTDDGTRTAAAVGPRMEASLASDADFDAPEASLASDADFDAPEEAAAGPAGSAEFDRARGALATLRLYALPEVGDALVAHYDAHPQFVWVADGAVSPRAHAVIAALAGADRYGLSPEDYRVALPDEVADETARAAALMAFEMRLSAAVLAYALDAGRGRIDPNRLSGYHDIPRKQIDLAAVLPGIAAAADAGAWLEGRQPGSAHFRALVAELAALRAADAEEERIEIAPGTFLRPGASSPEVYNIVAAIYRRSSDELKTRHADTFAGYAGGHDYTPALVELVRDFQRENRLQPDGIVGANTIRALSGLSNDDKIDKVVLAMERARWLPETLGARHVFVNQPAFRATYSEEGREPLGMKVVIGTKRHQTSFFVDEIELVEYNPYWGVPYSIIVNQMLPNLAGDPAYLDRLGYEVTTPRGQRVSSTEVDWYGVADKSVAINVRQPPGRSNALGELKIMFPNKHDIYMHDTPAKELFQRDERAFSAGCIRLEDPRAMAAAVLGRSTDYIAGRIAQGKNDTDRLDDKVPIYIAYFTAWPEPDGTVRYHADVYERDRHLGEALQLTARARRAEG